MAAIVESGGGSRGSHAAGVALYVGEQEKARYRSWFNWMWGTSVGSINTCGWAHERPEDFPAATRFVVDLWKKHLSKTTDVWKWRLNLPILRYIPGLWKSSLGKTDNLDTLLRNVVDPDKVRASGIECRWPAVSLKTEEIRVFDQNFPDMVTALMASSAFPVFFPLVEVKDDSKEGCDWFSDGGLRDIAPLGDAISGGNDKVLCILSRNPWREVLHPRPKNILQRGKWEIDIQSDEVLKNDIEKCFHKNERILAGELTGSHKLVELDVIVPSQDLGDSLDFSGDLMKRQIDLGYEDAYQYFQNKRLGL